MGSAPLEKGARDAQKRRDWPAAVEFWRACIEKFPDHPAVASWRGAYANILIELGRLEEAEAAFAALARDWPNFPPGFAGLARAAQTRRDWPLAFERLRTCAEKFPNDPAVHTWRGAIAKILVELGRHDEAEAAFRSLTLEQPDLPAGFAGLARLAQMRRDWPLAIEQWKSCVERFPNDPAVDSWRGAYAAILIDSGRLEEAEASLRALTIERPSFPAGFAGLARLAQKRRDWPLVLERWESCIEKFPNDPTIGAWRAARASSLERMEAWEAAHRAWDELAQVAGPGSYAAIRRARCLLEWVGPTEAAERCIAAVLKAAPTSRDAHVLDAQVAVYRGDDRTALARYLCLAELHPLDVQPYALAIGAMAHLGELRRADAFIANAPSGISETIEFQCRVLLPYHQLRANLRGGLELIEKIDEERIDLSSTISICSFLIYAARSEQLLAFSKRMLGRFSADVHLVAIYLMALFEVRGKSAFEIEKVNLLAGLGERDRKLVLRAIPVMMLTVSENKCLIDDLSAASAQNARSLQKLMEISQNGNAEIISYIVSRREARGNAGHKIYEELLVTKISDRRKIEYANLDDGVSWVELKESSKSARLAAESLTDIDDETEIDKPPQSLIELPRKLIESVSVLRSVTERSRAAWVNSAESYYDAAEFAAWLQGRIRRGEPTSVLRLGDGEGSFLPYPPSAREFQAPDQRTIQQIWWGEARIGEPQAEVLTQQFISSLRRSDAIGIPPTRRLISVLGSNASGGQNMRGAANAVAYLGELVDYGLRDKILTSCHIHTDLNDWDLYRQIFGAISSVSVVSCHDLARPLAQNFGLDIRCWFAIPPEHRYSGLFVERALDSGEHFYPTVFDRIMNEVAPLPGEVFLVAAGFLGKLICDRVRERGGIGVDIGSAADNWMGHKTRIASIADLNFDVSSSLIEGQPFQDSFRRDNISRAEPCRSDRTRRRNLAGILDRVFPAEAEAPNPAFYRLRVIGHPRCGSGYVAQVFRRLGLDLGHERAGTDGLVSWIHAVDDANPPFNAPRIPARAFQTRLAYVRDPCAAMPSILLENCRSESFDFRRFHIARELGIDIADRRDPLERAVASYLLWMKIVEAQRPLATLRVERLLDDLLHHSDDLAAAGLALNWALRDSAAAVPRDVNPSSHKFPVEKPEISAQRFGALPADLHDALAAFCERHDYVFSGAENPANAAVGPEQSNPLEPPPRC